MQSVDFEQHSEVDGWKKGDPIKALLLEDVETDQFLLEGLLESLHFSVLSCSDPEKAKKLFLDNIFEIAIVHIRNKSERGLEFTKWLRGKSTVPILMLTDRDSSVTEELCLISGADDYIVKPINENIVIARVEHQLRRNKAQHSRSDRRLTAAHCSLNPISHEFLVAGADVQLTATEFLFVKMLMEHPKKVFNRGTILDVIGILDGPGVDHILNAHASRIRKKIRAAGGPESALSVVRGLGYRFCDPKELVDLTSM